jgi:drug/metabolite transporter (DMT)-like permease
LYLIALFVVEGAVSRQSRSEILLALMCVIWGFTFPMIRGSLNTTDPHLYLALRFGLAAPLSYIVFRKRIDLRDWKVLLSGLFLGSILYVGMFFQTLGLVYTTASRSGFLTALYIVMVPLMMSAYRRKWPDWRVLLAALLSLVGVAFMVGWKPWASLPPSAGGLGVGDMLTIACAIAFAFQILFTGALPKPGRVWTLHFSQLSTVALLSFFSYTAFGEPRVLWNPELALSLFVTAALGTVLALGLQLRFQPDTSPERAALVFSAEPIFAALASWFLLSEHLGTGGLMGGALILFALLLSARAEGEAAKNIPVGL